MVRPQIRTPGTDAMLNLSNAFKTTTTIPLAWVGRQTPHAKTVVHNCNCYSYFPAAQRNSVADRNRNYPDVTKKVLRSQKVADAVARAAHDDLQQLRVLRGRANNSEDTRAMATLRDKHQRRAVSILRRMKSVVSSSLLRIAGFILMKLLGRMLSSIQYNKDQLTAIRRVQQNASATKAPIIFLPLHRSHLDYMLVSFILYMNNIKPPLVASGDNLNIPVFGSLLRGLGAFFIKRKIDPAAGERDHVYRAVLAAYMSENMHHGESLEFFVEGGRSRSGKAMCMPKTGLLSVVVKALLDDNQVSNAFIVPVAISYEKLIDGNFVAEQLGKPKVSESFTLAVRAIWQTLRSKFGSVRVDFGEPFALKEYVEGARSVIRNHDMSMDHTPANVSCTPKTPCTVCSPVVSNLRTVDSSASLYGTGDEVLDEPDKRRIIQELAEHVIYDASNGAALMSTQLLAFLLINQCRKGATLQQLVPKMDWLRDELSRRNRNIGFSGDSADVIRYAANLLGRGLVSTEIMEMAFVSPSNNASLDAANNNSSPNGRVKKIISLRPSNKLQSLIELQYYSNNVVSAFLIDSIVANAIASLVHVQLDIEPFNANGLALYRDQILTRAMELCNLLKYEFIVGPPCTDITVLLSETIDQFLQQGMLTSKVTDREISKSLTYGFDDDDGYSADTSEYHLTLSDQTCEIFHFYRDILAPFIESYWIASCALLALTNRTREYELFVEHTLAEAKHMLRDGSLCYPESVASDSIKNALALFENWGVIERKTVGGVTVVYLTRNAGAGHDTNKTVNEVILEMEKFKK